MSSHVHEHSSMENAGGNGTVKLTKSKRKRLNKKLRKLNAENPDSKQQLDQNNPNNSLITTATDDHKYPVLSRAEAHAAAWPDEEFHMVTRSIKRISDKIANGEMDLGTSTTATDNSTESRKTKREEIRVMNLLAKSIEIHRSTNNRPTLGEILNPQYLELMEPEYAKTAPRSKNKNKQQVANLKRVNMEREKEKAEKTIYISEPGFVKGEKRRRPTLGEILNPRYLEELEIADPKKELAREMSKNSNKIKVTHGQAEVKARNDEIPRVAILGKGKKLLIFDVNGLLADIVSPRPKDLVADKYIPKRAIFKRPFLDDFLRFCFERFHVGIWSSRTKKVLDPVVDFLLGDLKKNLLFIWDNTRCTNTGMMTLEDNHKPMVFKDLRKIWQKDGPSNSWVKGTFHELNTLLLDDSPYKGLINPKNTGVFPLSYSYKDRNDDFLGPNGDLRTYLVGLADIDDVKTYVEQHPFGQPAIDQTHPCWNFYSKALKGQNSTC